MRNIKLTIEFDGTAYHGWQSQDNAVTVQDTLEAAIYGLTGEKCTLIGSSRTDTGVHALGFVCNFFTSSSIPADKFAFALNTQLPADIVVKKSEEVPADFHARFSAKGKKYRYLIYNSVFPSALLRNRAYHVFYPLDVDAMDRAARYFEGTHDFYAFSASGRSTATTVRTITKATVRKLGLNQCDGSAMLPQEAAVLSGAFQGDSVTDSAKTFEDGSADRLGPNLISGRLQPVRRPKGELIEFSITGNGFLYNMVRIIAGTLVEIGFGKMKPEDVPDIIAGRDRRKAGRTAPAHGLYLVKVYYNEGHMERDL